MAKVLIDIPRAWEKCKISFLKDCIRNGIALNNLTNGEVMQKMFPQLRVTKWRDSVQVMGENYSFNHTYPLDWWNRKWGE